MPKAEFAYQVVSRVRHADPLCIDAAFTRPARLCQRRPGIGPGVGGSVNSKQPAAFRHQCGVVARPPGCQRDNSADVLRCREMHRHTGAHRVTDKYHVVAAQIASHPDERIFGVAQRVERRTVPASLAVLHPSDVDATAEVAPQ